MLYGSEQGLPILTGAEDFSCRIPQGAGAQGAGESLHSPPSHIHQVLVSH